MSIITYPDLQKRLHTDTIWVVTYVIERTGNAKVFYINAKDNTIIDQS